MDIPRHTPRAPRTKKRQLVIGGGAVPSSPRSRWGCRASSRRRRGRARHGRDRHGQARADGAPGARPRHAGARGDPLDPRRHRGPRRAHRACSRAPRSRPDTVILELSNPELELRGARRRVAAARRRGRSYIELKVRLESQLLDQQAAAARVQAEYAAGAAARRRRRRARQAGPGRRAHAQDLAQRRRRAGQPRTSIEQQRLGSAREAIEAQLAVQAARGRAAPGHGARCAATQVARRCRCAPASPACCSRCRSRWASGSRPGTNLARVAQPSS